MFVESGSSIIRDASPRDRRTVFVEDDVNVIQNPRQQEIESPQQQPSQPSQQPQPQSQSQQSSQPPQPRPRSTTQRRSEKRLSAANIMEKLKLTLFEKRKFNVAIRSEQQQQQQQQQQRQRGYKRSNRTRPLSYPNFLMRHSHRDDTQQPNNNNLPSTSELSRHQSSLPRSSNSQLSQIQEESDDLSRREPMVVDICT